MSLIFTVYGQLILKWRLNHLKLYHGSNFKEKVQEMLGFLFDPYIFSAFFSAFLAAMFWLAAMRKLPITEAYPFMSLAPTFVFIFGILFLNEEFSWAK
jgi:undecaprenyl phosphate-alpha-L-ara4N flippase subunit ArnF